MCVKFFAIGWLEAVRICIVKVWVVKNLVQRLYKLERIRVVVHLTHVIVLKYGAEGALWNLAECVFVFIKKQTRVGGIMDEYLYVFAF